MPSSALKKNGVGDDDALGRPRGSGGEEDVRRIAATARTRRRCVRQAVEVQRGEASREAVRAGRVVLEPADRDGGAPGAAGQERVERRGPKAPPPGPPRGAGERDLSPAGPGGGRGGGDKK